MRICLVAEGCYPYVVGGVSSWIQSLVTSMPEHQFVIVAIAPQAKERGRFRYQLPDNIVDVKELFLDEALNRRAKWYQKARLTQSEQQAFRNMLQGDPLDWSVLFDHFRSERALPPGDLLLSPEYYDLIQQAYSERYTHVPFTDVFWTLRSMYMTLFALLSESYPRADVYHAVSTGYAGVVAAHAAHAQGARLVLTEHGIYTREREEEIIKSDWVDARFKDMWIQYFRRLSDSIYARADRVCTLFEKNRRLQVELGCPPGKIRVVHNGVSLERFEDHTRPRPEQDKDVVVASILRVVPIKDIKTMLQAFAIVERKLPGVQLLLIGPTEENPEYFKECLAYMRFLGLERVRFTGRVDVRTVMDDIDIHVLSSISEGQPLSVMETLLCRIPNVTTNVGDCQALIEGEGDGLGRAGAVVPVMDYEGLAREIMELARRPDRRKRFGDAGHERIRRAYRHEQFIEAYRALYREMEDTTWQA